MKINITPAYNYRLLDEIIIQKGIQPLSLNPHKNIITSFQETENLIVEKSCNLEIRQCLYHTLENILKAQVKHFSENIFWDFDLMIANMVEQAIQSNQDGVVFLESFGNKVVTLMEMFGDANKIRFRYVHDFIYGFEWAKWVKKDPVNRANTKPFCLNFLDYLINKGQEILYLISVDDSRYHQISSHSYRNPFFFSRDPEDEYRLLTYMAQYQLIPVATWNWNTQPIWDKPFDQIREQLSLKLINK